MPFGFGKSRRRRQLADLPDDCVGWLEPGVEVEGKIKVTAGLIRVNTHVNGEITCDGTVVVHNEGEVNGDIHTRKISVTGKTKGAVHASESWRLRSMASSSETFTRPAWSLIPEAFSTASATCPRLNRISKPPQVIKNHHS